MVLIIIASLGPTRSVFACHIWVARWLVVGTATSQPVGPVEFVYSHCDHAKCIDIHARLIVLLLTNAPVVDPEMETGHLNNG